MNANDVQMMVSATSATNKTKVSNAVSYVKDAFDGVTTSAGNINNIQISHISTKTGLFIFELNNGVVVSVNIGNATV